MVVPLAALALLGLAAQVALADVPPPITVPTPTVPQPDPGPVPQPTPKPQPRPQPKPAAAATPSRPVTRTYTPAPATVAPKPRASRQPLKKRPAVKRHTKPKPSTQKPSANQGVKGAEKTNLGATESVASPGTRSSSKWLRTALVFAVVAILGVIGILFISASSPRTAPSSARARRLPAAGLRRRRTRPREVAVEVIQPKALRSPIPLPPVSAPEPPPAGKPAPAPHEELAAEQLLADIAPEAGEDTEVGSQPEPVRARPPFHEPALAQPTARQERLVEEQTASFAETQLQTSEADADEVSVTQSVEEICAIGLWRGYVKSRFYAGLIGGGEGIEYALAESQAVRLRGDGTPERTEAAAQAHEALVNYLIESGWEVDAPVNGECWYALRFRRAAAPAESNSA